jgi:nitrite reductase/ring-hydroxylating ferredoxin subunit
MTQHAAFEEFKPFLPVAELPPGSQRSIAHGFLRILLCHTDEGIFAVLDLCPHALQPLVGAEVAAGMIRCPKHGALFALATGEPRNGITQQRLRTFPVRVRDGQVEIDTAAPR